MTKSLLWELNLYRQFMCIYEDNDKNKKNLLPPPPQLQFS